MKNHPLVKILRAVRRALADQFGVNLGWVRGLAQLCGFVGEYRAFRALNAGSTFALRAELIQPCLTDRTETTPVEPTYFFQDTWCAGLIAARRPAAHVDVASSAKSMAMISQFVPVTFVDIRPVELAVPGFVCVRGSVLELPFADGSVASLSSLCVIEHIGLGRYGDPLDGRGSERAAAELGRVLARGGDLYVSMPVDVESRVYFNAHRAFTREHALELFPGLELEEERYVYGTRLQETYAPDLGFGTGLFHFRKP